MRMKQGRFIVEGDSHVVRKSAVGERTAAVREREEDLV